MPVSNRKIIQKLSSYLGFIFLCLAAVLIFLQVSQGTWNSSYDEYFGPLFVVGVILLIIGKLLD